jgi:ribonuclease HII
MRRTGRPSPESIGPARTGDASGSRRGPSFATLYTIEGRAQVPPWATLRRDPDWSEEAVLWRRGYRFVAGIDEVGRGCLAGPVVAAAVILPPGRSPAGLRDSKLLDAPSRERLAAEVRACAIAWGIGVVESELIDGTNILEATILASQIAAARLAIRPDALLLDAIRLPGIEIHQRSLPSADRLCMSVAAASVVAKAHRDALMIGHDARYPGYGFGGHKGYASPEHRAALEALGPCAIHRRSFAPCAAFAADDADRLTLWMTVADTGDPGTDVDT